MQYFFCDTCSLLYEGSELFNNLNFFYISNLTLKELQNIKTSNTKDPQIKWRARKLIHLLTENKDKYEIINYQNSWDEQLKQYSILSDNIDSKIILTVLILQAQKNQKIKFYTQDFFCERIAESLGLDVEYLKQEDSTYKGYISIQYYTDDELADLYSKIYDYKDYFELLNNQYILIKDSKGQIIDRYKKINHELKRVPDFICFDSKMFGKVKPKDEYQLLAMDSLQNNKITMLRGAAGTGKSYLSLAYLFSALEHHNIDKIIIFCNTVATNGSAKLGYYPGSKDEKLLDSQIGNFLASKLGDKEVIIELIEKGQLILLPMSDIRGFDATGMHAGIYITEAQNMDIELMRLALQRIGQDSICILDGDSDAQVDLSMYAGSNNGMRRVSQVFRGQDIYGEITLPNIYRSKIAKIAQEM